MELDEIQRRIEDEPLDHVQNDSKSKDEQWFSYFDKKKGGDVFLKVVRVVVEDISNRHNNFAFGFRIKEKVLEDENQMFKNMSKIWKLDRTILLCLRKVEKGKLFTQVRKVNELLKKIESKDATEDNDLFYLGAALLTKVIEKNKTKFGKKQP